MNVFITGISSGIGKALALIYLENGYNVYGISRKQPKIRHENLHFKAVDLSKVDTIDEIYEQFLPQNIELAILNAGILGDIKELTKTTLDEIRIVMDTNVWANKILIDLLIQNNCKQVIAMSSGASVNGSKGWSSYSLSKSTLNMLIKLYAAESKTHFTAFAPGLIQTDMLGYITSQIDPEQFPSVQRLQESPKKTPMQCAQEIFEIAPKLLEYESGSFLDIRTM